MVAEVADTVGGAPLRMAELGPQRQAEPATEAQRRARYFNSANAFDIRLPAVPAQSFAAQALQALDPGTATGWLACDQSAALGAESAATTPLMLARYGRIKAGERLASPADASAASGSICYVIEGSGRSDIAIGSALEAMSWQAGDVMFFPGGEEFLHHADAAADAVLWLVTDEPLPAFIGLRPAAAFPAGAVHYPADEIRRQLDLIFRAEPEATTSGRALIFSTAALEASHNIHPVLTLSLNTLAPGASQAAHKHNSAAVTLVVVGDVCHTTINGEAMAWQPWTTMVTPPGAVHAHHNRGPGRALFLIVQDGGLHYRARTMGFENVAG